MQRRLVVTGGHATPAIAVIEALRARGDWKIDWIGEEKAIAGVAVKTLEATVLPEMGIPFHSIIAPKFHRGDFLKTVFSFWKFPVGMFQSLFLLLQIRPSVVLTFGSYLSFPVALSAFILRIPVIVHEQTAASGLANRMVSKFAKRVAISFLSSSNYFAKSKIILTGNPIRTAFFEIAKKRERRETVKNKPKLLVFGGSRGAVAINSVILEALKPILLKFDLLHVTGDLDFSRVEKERTLLPIELKAKYRIFPTLNFVQVESALEKVDLAIGRAGANTVSEFAAVGLPAIFIPLPMTDSDEQTKNAQVLVDRGSSLILNQGDLTSELLLEYLDKMLENLDLYKQKAKEARVVVVADAALRIAKLVEEFA